MEVPEDCEEDDLPLASRGSVKFWFDLRRDQAPHGATCGADWELNKKTKNKRKRYHDFRMIWGERREALSGGETTGHLF